LLHAQGASASALSCGESVMLLRVAENIRQCLDNAAEARQRAQEAIDSERKAHFSIWSGAGSALRRAIG
jgi:hypothetical protein